MKDKLIRGLWNSALVVALFVLLSTSELQGQAPCLKDAWQAFNSQDYMAAIKAASKCIDDFAAMADREQAKIEKDGVPVPPTGSVDAAEKARIFGRGVLNDTGTAFFIKGRSAEYLYNTNKNKKQKLGFKTQAIEAYRTACKYKYARTWDPQGWFWSPCEASSDRLQALQ